MRLKRNSSTFFLVKEAPVSKMKGLADDIPARRQIFSEAEIAEYDAQAEREAHAMLLNHSKAITPVEPAKVPEVEETEEEPLMLYYNYPLLM